MHALHEEVSALMEFGGKATAPFGGRWKQPKQGPWVSVSIHGKYPGPRGKAFSGNFPLGNESLVQIIKKGYKPWLVWAHERWGHEPFTIAAFRHPKQGDSRDVLWYWDSSDGFRGTVLSREILKKRGKVVAEMNGDAVAHVIAMAKKHGVKVEGPNGKLTPAQVRKLAAMREGLGEVVERLVEEDSRFAVGSTFIDKTGSRFKVLRRYKRKGLDGYVGEALPGSKLTQSGTIYHGPYTRVAKVLKRVDGRPAPMDS